MMMEAAVRTTISVILPVMLFHMIRWCSFPNPWCSISYIRQRIQRAIPSAAPPRSGGSVRGSPCGEPARLRFTSLCPPFFLLRGYPRERISYGSGAPPSCGDSAGPSCCVPFPCGFPEPLPY